MDDFERVGEQAFSDEDYKAACLAANDYSVSLINGDDLIGSATLVSIGGVLGLLTANHVWQAILSGRSQDHLCLVLGPHLQRFDYQLAECVATVIGNQSTENAENGPDLAFIRLTNPIKNGKIASCKSFYPVVSEHLSMFESLSPQENYWFVWGAPAEKSSIVSTLSGSTIRKVTHFVGWAHFNELYDRDGFDYVKLEISSGESNFPNRYGGVSGGGAWIAYFQAEDPKGEKLKPAIRVFLAGVAYYECFPTQEEPNVETLVLHGPKSIYKQTVQAVNR